MRQQEILAFLAVAKLGTVSAAAEALHYAQPTVSAYLDRLEKELGIRLVKRRKGKREVDLTPAGAEFLPIAQQYAELDKKVLRFIKEHQRGTLRLAASVVSHQYIVCHLIQKLLRQVPDPEIRLSTIEIKDLSEAMKERAFDVAISYDDPSSSEPLPEHITRVPLFEEEYCILCPTDTPLPNRILSPEELDGTFEVIHQGYGEKLLNDWRESYGFSHTRPYFSTSSMLSVHNYLSEKKCWSFMLTTVAQQMVSLHPERLTFRKVSPAPAPRCCSAYILKSYPEEGILQALLQCMAEVIDERCHLKKLY